MAKKPAVVAEVIEVHRSAKGRPTRYATRITGQIPVGLDENRFAQLNLIREHLQSSSAGRVTMSDVMREAFDEYVKAHAKEVNGLLDTIQQ